MISAFHKQDKAEKFYIIKAGKRCPCCKEEKLISEFQKDKSRRDGRDVYCWLCRKMKTRPKREKTPEQKKRDRIRKCKTMILYWQKQLNLTA